MKDKYILPYLGELPPSMRSRAIWARKQILENPKIAEIDEDELLAWVYHKEDGVWYSISGNYSNSSPIEKMEKRRVQQKKNFEYEKKRDRESLKLEIKQKYWSKVRNRILERDNYTCQRCKQEFEKYHIHHIVKVKESGSDADDNLMTTCHKCHKILDTKEYGV